MRLTRLITPTAGLLVALAPAAAAQALSQRQLARVDSLVRATMDAHQVVGLQVAIGTHADSIWSRGYGRADLEHDAPVTAETRFRTASVSEWMSATAAMRLVERGALDLDAPVERYCPEYPAKRWTVTTHHLLMHRAGVRHYWGTNGEPRATAEQRDHLDSLSDDERLWMIVRYTDVIRPLDRFKHDTLLFEPGTRYRYTSFGYRLVGCVLQGAGGAPYAALMDELVFEPAGMTSTMNDDAYAIVPGRARGYTRTPGGELRRSRFRDVSENLPAGGHLSTAADLVRFALAFETGVLVSTHSKARMTARPAGEPADGGYYGYGVNVVAAQQLGGRTLLVHSGGQDETRTLLVLVPDARIAVATMTNYEPFGAQQQQLVMRILAIALEGR